MKFKEPLVYPTDKGYTMKVEIRRLLEPVAAFECSDHDGDTCDDCSTGHYDTSDDGYDYDGDGQCDDGDCDDDNDGCQECWDYCP